MFNLVWILLLYFSVLNYIYLSIFFYYILRVFLLSFSPLIFPFLQCFLVYLLLNGLQLWFLSQIKSLFISWLWFFHLRLLFHPVLRRLRLSCRYRCQITYRLLNIPSGLCWLRWVDLPFRLINHNHVICNFLGLNRRHHARRYLILKLNTNCFLFDVQNVVVHILCGQLYQHADVGSLLLGLYLTIYLLINALLNCLGFSLPLFFSLFLLINLLSLDFISLKSFDVIFSLEVGLLKLPRLILH